MFNGLSQVKHNMQQHEHGPYLLLLSILGWCIHTGMIETFYNFYVVSFVR